jgi:hypothetical protein
MNWGNEKPAMVYGKGGELNVAQRRDSQKQGTRRRQAAQRDKTFHIDASNTSKVAVLGC